MPHTHEADENALAPRISAVISTAHAQWSAMAERRRMRAFGFRPAVEPGVLKREWRGLEVRVAVPGIVARGPDTELLYDASTRELSVDGVPFDLAKHQDSADALLDLIHEYERWVEAREGREGRIQRGRDLARDRRPVNALAETRRLQRVLNNGRR